MSTAASAAMSTGGSNFYLKLFSNISKADNLKLFLAAKDGVRINIVIGIYFLSCKLLYIFFFVHKKREG
jgi:hypothetical protein